jgi:hypothetical protein
LGSRWQTIADAPQATVIVDDDAALRVLSFSEREITELREACAMCVFFQRSLDMISSVISSLFPFV